MRSARRCASLKITAAAAPLSPAISAFSPKSQVPRCSTTLPVTSRRRNRCPRSPSFEGWRGRLGEVDDDRLRGDVAVSGEVSGGPNASLTVEAWIWDLALIDDASEYS